MLPRLCGYVIRLCCSSLQFNHRQQQAGWCYHGCVGMSYVCVAVHYSSTQATTGRLVLPRLCWYVIRLCCSSLQATTGRLVLPRLCGYVIRLCCSSLRQQQAGWCYHGCVCMSYVCVAVHHRQQPGRLVLPRLCGYVICLFCSSSQTTTDRLVIPRLSGYVWCLLCDGCYKPDWYHACCFVTIQAVVVSQNILMNGLKIS